jgi:hypothetical protein
MASTARDVTMRPRPPRDRTLDKKGKTRPVVPQQSAAGEEDPGASLDDPDMREAMRGEARAAGDPAAARQREQSETALENVRDDYGGAAPSGPPSRGTSRTRKAG